MILAVRLKKLLLVLGILVILLVVFRGFIYRSLIHYESIGVRSEIRITNSTLIEVITKRSQNEEITVRNIVTIADQITQETLEFTTNRASKNPNDLRTQKANCVGYSAMFNAVANYLIRKHGLQNEVQATHNIGQLYFLGTNLHQYFENSFFKDHDFNTITNTKSGEKVLIDPTVSDYLWIKQITARPQS
ncbi:MAG: hypothetical protein AAF740_07970 [Bacteroidota bacterium]